MQESNSGRRSRLKRGAKKIRNARGAEETREDRGSQEINDSSSVKGKSSKGFKGGKDASKKTGQGAMMKDSEKGGGVGGGGRVARIAGR